MTDTVQTKAVTGVEIFVALNKLKKSPKNARKVPHGEAAIEALAASIHHKGLIQNLVVEPEMKDGEPTGYYLVTAGEGRRLAMLLRAKRRQIKKSHTVRCWLDTENDPAEISLDENITRTAMHPADQYERFHELSCQLGWGAEEIGARFGVSPDTVKRRLKLGAVSPKLMDVYRQDGLTLDQLGAFAITGDHARQEQVFEQLAQNKEPWFIRRELTADKVPATDRRAVFIGVDAYQEAGGVILRDLFTPDGGGYFEDAGLLDTLVIERLREIAGDVLAAGWKWAEASIDFPHDHGLRRYYPQSVDLSAEDAARLETASAEYDALVEGYSAYDEMPEDVAKKAQVLSDEVDAIDAKRAAFDPAAIARGGAFVTLTHGGDVQILRGYVRAEDEPKAEPEPEDEAEEQLVDDTQDEDDEEAEAELEDTDPGKPISDVLVRDLTAHRTLGLRLAVDANTGTALVVLAHAMAAQLFYRSYDASCIELHVKSPDLRNDADGIANTAPAEMFAEREDGWAQRLPSDVADLWAFVAALDTDSLLDLLGHCTAQTVNAVKVPWERKSRQLAAAETLASAVDLDMTAHWTATSRTYFGRVTKAHIASAVREAVGPEAAGRIASMKKTDMADAAEQLVTGTGWLPSLLRTRTPEPNPSDQPEADAPVVIEDGEAMSTDPVEVVADAEAPEAQADDAEEEYAIAAE